MRKLWHFLSDQGFDAAILSILILSAIAANAAGIIIAIVNKSAKHAFSGEVDIKNVLLFFLALAVFLIIRRLALRKINVLSETVIEIYRLKIVDLIRQTELLQIERLGEDDIYIKLTKDATQVSQALRKSVKGFESLVISIFVLLYILWQYTGAALLIFAFVSIAAVLYLIVYEILYPLIHKVTDEETALFGLLTHLMDGFKELKVDHEKNEELYQQYLLPLAKSVRALRIRLNSLFAEIETTSDMLHYLAIGGVLFLFPFDVSIAVRFQITAMILFLWNHVYKLYDIIPTLTAAGVAVERLSRLEAQLSPLTKPVEWVPIIKRINRFHELRVEDLVFHYTDQEGNRTYTVGPITLSIHPGEIMFIVGGNGSGKTTFVKLLTGLYQPFSGTFRIDDVEVNITEHRYLFTPVFSDCHVFDSLYGLGEVDNQQVDHLLHLMELDQKTQWQNQRFSSLALSTGERKRLALISAILEVNPIYVFDEWAAEQDPHFRNDFYEELLPKFKAQGKAIVAITHDERYFHRADRIVKMHDGKLLEGWTWQPETHDAE